MRFLYRAACALALILAVLPSANAQAPEAAPPDPKAEAPGRWERTNIAFGLSTYHGQGDSVQLHGQVNSTVQNGRLESDGIGNFGFSQSSGQQLVDQQEIDWALRYLLAPNSRYFWMVHSWYEHDETAGLDFRGAIGPGFGVHLRDTPTMRLTLEGGVAATSEKQVVDQKYAALFFDPSVRWKISEKASMNGKVNFRLNTEDSEDVRTYAQSDFNLMLTQRVGLGFSVTVDFDNVPVGRNEKTDIQTSTNLTIALGRQ